MISELPLQGSFRLCTNDGFEASHISGRSWGIIYSRSIFCIRFEFLHLCYPFLELFILAFLVRMSLVLDMKVLGQVVVRGYSSSYFTLPR